MQARLLRERTATRRRRERAQLGHAAS
jgi:hypothetical protein